MVGDKCGGDQQGADYAVSAWAGCPGLPRTHFGEFFFALLAGLPRGCPAAFGGRRVLPSKSVEVV